MPWHKFFRKTGIRPESWTPCQASSMTRSIASTWSYDITFWYCGKIKAILLLLIFGTKVEFG
jgi:hypothetical protein